MDVTVKSSAEVVSLIKVKEETKLVLEAFLKRSLIRNERTHIGHVGRAYHDPKKFLQGPHHDEKEGSTKRKKKTEKKRSKDPEQERDDLHSKEREGSSWEQNGTWNSLHEKINHAEEKKHGFQTSIKKLLRRHSQPKEKPSAKGKSGSIHGKSRESLENVLDEPKKGGAKGDSLKRQKLPIPILACATAGSVDNLAHKEKGMVEMEREEKHQSKPSRSFTFKNILKMKSKGQSIDMESPPVRPAFLPVTPCYQEEAPRDTDKVDDSEIYNLAAKKLDSLVRQKILKSPTGPAQPPIVPGSGEGVRPQVSENNNVVTSETTALDDKEDIIRKLVALLQEQAVVINDQINKDPFLRNALSRMSYGSFSRLAEVFTSQAGAAAGEVGGDVSPELTKIALTMELTRKVAGINSHAVHTLMGYSLQYMDMFVPWLQKQGGWENIVFQGDMLDFQID